MIALLGRAILDVGPCLSWLGILLASPFLPVRSLWRNQLTVLWELLCKPRSPLQTYVFICDFLFLSIFYRLCYYSCPISPPSLNSILPTPSLPHSPPYSSCPWVILISSLASTFPTLFLPSPCLFSTYHLYYLFSVPFSPSSPPTPLLTTLHVISISMVLFLF